MFGYSWEQLRFVIVVGFLGGILLGLFRAIFDRIWPD